MRDHWNDVVAADPEATKAEVIEIIKKAGTLTYSEIQELKAVQRNACRYAF